MLKFCMGSNKGRGGANFFSAKLSTLSLKIIKSRAEAAWTASRYSSFVVALSAACHSSLEVVLEPIWVSGSPWSRVSPSLET